METILAFDTSTNKGGVAVLHEGQIASRLAWDREGSHGELLTPALQKCLEDAGLKPADLSMLSVGIGPGSFTGVRCAVNAARALAYVLKKPVYAFDTTEVLAEPVRARTDLPLVVMVNAHKNLVYASTFEWRNETWERVVPVAALDVADLEKRIDRPHLCIGDGFAAIADRLPEDLRKRLVRDSAFSDEPVPEALARLAEWTSQIRQPLDWKDVQALYIRASGAEEQLAEKLEKVPGKSIA